MQCFNLAGAPLAHARTSILGTVVCAALFIGCKEATKPVAPHSGAVALSQSVFTLGEGEPNAGAGDIKAFIGAWLDGEAVQLRYTRSFYCEEPPESIAPSGCEIGAAPENFPREGLIPMIYALAPVGFTPSDITTLHCSPSAPCANHPPMIDVTRLNIPGVSIGTRPPHSHIITTKQAGWHRTVNIRVLSSSVWDQIAAAPSLETVRQMQAAYPTLISSDIPTNIFFFFEVHDVVPVQ